MLTIEGLHDAGMVEKFVTDGGPVFLCYRPGNGTQYFLVLNLILQLEEFDGFPVDGSHVLVSWVGHGAYGFDLNDPPHWSYVAEKLGCGQGDAFPIADLLAKMSAARKEATA